MPFWILKFHSKRKILILLNGIFKENLNLMYFMNNIKIKLRKKIKKLSKKKSLEIHFFQSK